MALFGHKDTAKLAKMLMEQQQAPIRKTLGAESRPTRDRILGKLTTIEQLMQYKPTEEQRAQALRDMANTTYKKVELPRQIEMPPLEINRSEHKAVNLFWDTLESILPK